jgi:dTDP-4-dehydrorhamnose 3,5-epimerase
MGCISSRWSPDPLEQAVKVTPTALPDVLMISPNVFGDERGFFFESWNHRAFAAAGLDATFVQDNHSRSVRNVLRGLHYQIEHAQGKLVRVCDGEVLDVAVDLRRSSPTFGRSLSVTLSAKNKQMLWIPPGFAHGFLVLSDAAEFLYKTTDYWYAEHERTLLWNDPALGIDWPLSGAPLLAAKDAAGRPLALADVYP